MARLDISLPEPLLKDLKEYCLRNSLNVSEFVRHLIRIEIYHEKSLDKKVTTEKFIADLTELNQEDIEIV